MDSSIRRSRSARAASSKKSFALIDQLRSIDKCRVPRVFGDLAQNEMAAIDEGLAVFLGLDARLHALGRATSPVRVRSTRLAERFRTAYSPPIAHR